MVCSRNWRRVGIKTAALMVLLALSSLSLFAQDSGSDDRIVLGAPRSTPRSSLETGLRGRVRDLLDPAAGVRNLVPLLAVAFAYGIVHALGPGHQKTLLGGYFLGEGGSLGRAALAAIVTSCLHAVSVLAIFGGLALASRSFADTERTRALLTRAAGIALLAVALYMAAKRVRAAAIRLASAHPDPREHSHHHGEGVPCAACRRMERERARGAPFWSMLLAGGMIPCPGAAFFLLFGISSGNSATGVLAVLALSAGMAVTLFLVAVGATAAREAVLRASAKTARARDIALSVVEMAGSAAMVAFAAAMVF